MSDSNTETILAWQNRLRIRLAELGLSDSETTRHLQRHLAEIAVLGDQFAQHTLPLFLSMSPEHAESIARVATAMKCDLDELRDALVDVETDLIELTEFLNRTAPNDT